MKTLSYTSPGQTKRPETLPNMCRLLVHLAAWHMIGLSAQGTYSSMNAKAIIVYWAYTQGGETHNENHTRHCWLAAETVSTTKDAKKRRVKGQPRHHRTLSMYSEGDTLSKHHRLACQCRRHKSKSTHSPVEAKSARNDKWIQDRDITKTTIAQVCTQGGDAY